MQMDSSTEVVGALRAVLTTRCRCCNGNCIFCERRGLQCLITTASFCANSAATVQRMDSSTILMAWQLTARAFIVCDRGNSRACVFAADGSFITAFGVQGIEPGQFISPVGVCVDRTG